MKNSKPFVRTVDEGVLSLTDKLNERLKKHSLSFERIVAALFASLMASYAYQLLRNGNFGELEAYYNSINFIIFIPLALIVFALLMVLTVRLNQSGLIPWAVLLFSAAVSVLWIRNYSGENRGWFILGVGVFDLIVLIWLMIGNKLGIPGLDSFGKRMHALAQRIDKAIGSVTARWNKALSKVSLTIENIITALLASLMLSHIYQLVSHAPFSQLGDYFKIIDLTTYLLITVLGFALMLLLTAILKLPYLCPWALMVFVVVGNFLLAYQAQGYTGGDAAWFALGLGVFDLVLILWLVRGDKLGLTAVRISRRTALIAAAVMFVAAMAAFGWFTSLKYHNYSTSTFDFGIFAQMFERMAQTGQPFTTVERSYMMLHYGVHFSPFFYIFLPGYYIFRSPLYLYFIQAAGVAAGVFAVWLLAGKLGLSGKLTLALEALYILYPCLFNGTFYDFHENKFLTAVILFLFYFSVSKKPVGIVIFSLLLLSIKEDAAIYLMVIAAFVVINRKEIFTGVMMFLMAIVYFVIAQKVIAASGLEGVMMTRLQDYFINGEQTFGSVIKAVFFDLGHTIGQVFTEEKMPFVIWMLGAVLFAPIMNAKISSLLLLLPILPINLMQSWQYQYDIDFQYTYGVAAMVLVTTIFALVRLGGAKRRALLLTMLCLCMTMSVLLTAPKIRTVTQNAEKYKVSYESVDEVLDMIPDDATVTASDVFVPHLYRIKWLFTAPDYYKQNWDRNPITPYQTDYVVIDTRYRDHPKRGAWLKEIMGDNYKLVGSGGFAELYERKLKVKVIE